MHPNVLSLLRSQHGLLSRRQACLLEPDRSARRSLYACAEMRWETPRVLRHLAAPVTVEQRLMLAVLDSGTDALLWGKTAASHWGFGRFRRVPTHVAVRRRSVRLDDRVARIHAVRHLSPIDRTTHLSIPVARPEVAILWLAGMWTHRLGHEVARVRTAVAVDQAWRQRLIDGAYLHALADRAGGRGRSGIVVLRDVLEDRPPEYAPAGSRLEERFEASVPSRIRRDLVRQVTVDVDPVIRTVDYRLESWPLIVEINGEAWHSSISDRAADEERYAALLDAGFSVVVFWEYDVWHDPAAIADTMRTLADTPDSEPTLHRPTPAPWAL